MLAKWSVIGFTLELFYQSKYYNYLTRFTRLIGDNQTILNNVTNEQLSIRQFIYEDRDGSAVILRRGHKDDKIFGK